MVCVASAFIGWWREGKCVVTGPDLSSAVADANIKRFISKTDGRKSEDGSKVTVDRVSVNI